MISRETLKRIAHPAFRILDGMNSLKTGLKERNARNHSSFAERVRAKKSTVEQNNNNNKNPGGMCKCQAVYLNVTREFNDR